MKSVVVGGITLLAVFLCLTAGVSAQLRGYEGGMGHAAGGYGMSWFWAVLMFALWFAVMVALFLLIRLLSLMVGERSRPAKAGETSLDILKRRYAGGEIGKEEFEEKKRDLGA